MEPNAEWFDGLPMASPSWRRHWREVHSLDESIVVKPRGKATSLRGRAACIRDSQDVFYALPTSLWDLAFEAAENCQDREPIAFAAKTRIRQCLETMASARTPTARAPTTSDERIDCGGAAVEPQKGLLEPQEFVSKLKSFYSILQRFVRS
jgi:hypothetical protein